MPFPLGALRNRSLSPVPDPEDFRKSGEGLPPRCGAAVPSGPDALSRFIGAFQDGDVREFELGRSALWIFVLSDVPELGHSFLSLPYFVWAHRPGNSARTETPIPVA